MAFRDALAEVLQSARNDMLEKVKAIVSGFNKVGYKFNVNDPQLNVFPDYVCMLWKTRT